MSTFKAVMPFKAVLTATMCESIEEFLEKINFRTGIKCFGMNLHIGYKCRKCDLRGCDDCPFFKTDINRVLQSMGLTRDELLVKVMHLYKKLNDSSNNCVTTRVIKNYEAVIVDAMENGKYSDLQILQDTKQYMLANGFKAITKRDANNNKVNLTIMELDTIIEDIKNNKRRRDTKIKNLKKLLDKLTWLDFKKEAFMALFPNYSGNKDLSANIQIYRSLLAGSANLLSNSPKPVLNPKDTKSSTGYLLGNLAKLICPRIYKSRTAEEEIDLALKWKEFNSRVKQLIYNKRDLYEIIQSHWIDLVNIHWLENDIFDHLVYLGILMTHKIKAPYKTYTVTYRATPEELLAPFLFSLFIEEILVKLPNGTLYTAIDATRYSTTDIINTLQSAGVLSKENADLINSINDYKKDKAIEERRKNEVEKELAYKASKNKALADKLKKLSE